jgi:hypothetical protein
LIGSHLVDEVARSLVLLLKNGGITRKALGANEIGVDGTSVIRADGNMVSSDFLRGSEVLECPLKINVTLGPANDGNIFASDAIDIVDRVRSIFGVDLSIVQKISRDVEPNGVGIG